MIESKRILIVEDDPGMRDMMASYLDAQGFQVQTAATGRNMQAVLERDPIDLMLLDLNLPDADGLDLARSVRAKSNMGVIIVSSRTAPEERASGLEIGADDYITKPFYPREMLARVKNVLERTGRNGEALLNTQPATFGAWIMDRTNRLVMRTDGTEAKLTPAEFDLLSFMAARPGQLLSRETLHDAIATLGGQDTTEDSRSVDILVSRLRTKLHDTDKDHRLIETVRGHGYRFTTS